MASLRPGSTLVYRMQEILSFELDNVDTLISIDVMKLLENCPWVALWRLLGGSWADPRADSRSP